MRKVRIKTSDGKIWDKEKVIIDLIHASQQGAVTLDLLAEGPCCQTVGIGSMLETVIDKFGFDPAIYTIQTSNQLSSSRYKEHRMPFVELQAAQHKARSIGTEPSNFDKRFGIFIGRSNWIRLALASYLDGNWADQTVMTYHYDPQSDYHTSNFGLETLLNKCWQDAHLIFNFLKKLPIRDKIYQYPILWQSCAFDLDQYYHRIFCEVVCETYYSGRVFFMTEKIMRAIINRKPFLIQGPVGFLKNLKSLGFKTFDQWWDEGYDEDPWDFKHLALRQNIDYIGQQTDAIIKCWYQEMQPVLQHNYDVFMSLTSKNILEHEFYA